jgi:hypothetical protein
VHIANGSGDDLDRTRQLLNYPLRNWARLNAVQGRYLSKAIWIATHQQYIPRVQRLGCFWREEFSSSSDNRNDNTTHKRSEAKL